MWNSSQITLSNVKELIFGNTQVKALLNAADARWGSEATLMFELSSPMGDLPEVRRYLLEHNWTIYPHPKLFVQLNHSDVLREFLQITLSILEDSEAAHTLPKGW